MWMCVWHQEIGKQLNVVKVYFVIELMKFSLRVQTCKCLLHLSVALILRKKPVNEMSNL